MGFIAETSFEIANTPEEAVDRLAALHRQASGALSQALKRYLKERVAPTAAERALFRYPELRLTYLCQGDEVPSTTRAYAKVQVPGTYSVTVTQPDAFRGYLLDQLRPLMNDFTVTVETGISEQNIPYPYVVKQGDELAVERFMRRYFQVPMACMTGRTSTRCRWPCSMPRGWISRSSVCSTTPVATGVMCSRGFC